MFDYPQFLFTERQNWPDFTKWSRTSHAEGCKLPPYCRGSETRQKLELEEEYDISDVTVLWKAGASLHSLSCASPPCQILSWLLNLRHCNSMETMDLSERDEVLLRAFCAMSPEQWYIFSLLMARHVDMEKLIFRVSASLFVSRKGTWFTFFSS